MKQRSAFSGRSQVKVLVTYASKMGGTEGIAERLHDALVERGLDVDLVAIDRIGSPAGYDAVIVGSGLYAGHWRRAAKRFVKRNATALRTLPVWFFSSGPLDDSAARRVIPPVRQVEALMRRVDARGHATIGGRLGADARGFPASAMAKKNSGDWRDPAQIRGWADDIADALVRDPACRLSRSRTRRSWAPVR
jgi:menaquinone-dependent protoporphyrinogen oxidase